MYYKAGSIVCLNICLHFCLLESTVFENGLQSEVGSNSGGIKLNYELISSIYMFDPVTACN